MKQLLIKPISLEFEHPVYATDGSAAFDIRTPVDFELKGKQPVTVHLGFAAKVPEGHGAFLLPRSGLGSDHGMQLRNTVGLIDSDYTGEWQATMTLDMFGCSDKKEFQRGDRILQCVILPVEQVEFKLVTELPETERGSGGYGSTGVK